jgi:hypothetical protein
MSHDAVGPRRFVLPAALFLLFVDTSVVCAEQAVTPLPEDLEIELARSALPPHLREAATVHVLRPETGFEVAVRGTNGFHALVVRNDPAFAKGDWPYPAWRDDLLVPIAFDAAGVPAQMQVLLDVAAARARGASPSDVRHQLRERFASGHYAPPARAGMAYMLSPILRAYRDGGESDAVGTFVYPHFMAYAPDVTSEEIGGGGGRGWPFVLEAGPHGYIIIPAGRAEREAIVAEHAAMLAQLCELRDEWCVEADR